MKLFVPPEPTGNYKFNPKLTRFQESPFSTSADSKIYYLTLKMCVSGHKITKSEIKCCFLTKKNKFFFM